MTSPKNVLDAHHTQILNITDQIIAERDSFLIQHHRRMGKMSMRYAENLGLETTQSSLLYIGCRLHDIGKMCITAEILDKPRKLTMAEYAVVKQHTEIGNYLLEPLQMDHRIRDIVRFHHENYDGSGYPSGLQGKRIPFLARITRILDSFDALTMQRPYHPGLSAQEALDRLGKDAHLYDPNLLEDFFRFPGKQWLIRPKSPATCGSARSRWSITRNHKGGT